MDTGWLKDFTTILLAGFGTICLAYLALRLVPLGMGRPVIRSIRVSMAWLVRKGSPLNVIAGVLLSLGVFAVGLVASAVSDWAVDSLSSSRIPLLMSENDVRAKTLVKSNGLTCCARPLGAELAREGLFRLIGTPEDAKVEIALRSGEPFQEPSLEAVGQAASRLYYHCKNVTSTLSGPQQQLDYNQRLIDLCRTALLAAFIVGGIYLAWSFVIFATKTDAAMDSELVKVAMACLGFLSTVVLTRYLHIHFEIEFNKIAFGNYVTQFREGKVSPTHGMKPILSSLPSTDPLIPGISGVAPVFSNQFLVVHDAKGASPSPRFGIITFEPTKFRYSTPRVEWGEQPLPSDLEAVCKRASGANEYFASESSHYDPKRPGRLFRFELTVEQSGGSLVVLKDWTELPKDFVARDPHNPRAEFDQIEGMATYIDAMNREFILLGERRTGAIRHYEVDWTKATWKLTSTFTVPSLSENFNRRISDMTLCQSGDQYQLWVSASFDSDTDWGPFRSMAFHAASMSNGVFNPVAMPEGWVVPSFKVEGIVFLDNKKELLVGTDDEKLGVSIQVLGNPNILKK